MNSDTTPIRLTANTVPTLRGKLGDAWLVDLDAVNRRRGRADDPRASVALPCWIASAAYAHHMWSHYVIMCIALRDVPGVPKAKINLEGATHEVMVYALDPDRKPAIDDAPKLLLPANFSGQFVETDDLRAAARIQSVVQDVIDGTLNPDTDFRQMWVERFSASNLKSNAMDSDFIAVRVGGDMLVHGMGSSNVRNMQQIVNTASTLGADETKPQ